MKFFTPFLWLILLCVDVFADAHIFVYHRFGDSKHQSTNTSIDELVEQFDFFKNHGYEVVALETLVDALSAKKDIPDNWVVLTIDDGYQSFYDNGLEVFKRYGYPFSVFVYVKATNDGYGDFMGWDELKEVQKYGSVEFHSNTHVHMVSLSDDELQDDFSRGISIFYKNMRYMPKYFAYPYGEFDTRVENVAREFGFKGILNQNMGAVSNTSGIYDLDRNALTGGADHKYYLGLKSLDVKFLEPKRYPEDGILKSIKAEVPKKYKRVEVYVSGYGWKYAKVNDGKIDFKFDKKLNKKSVRIMVKYGKRIKAKILVKKL